MTIDEIVEQKINERLADLMPETPEAIRISKGFYPEDLANKSGVSAVTIRRLELGKTKNPDPDIVIKLAAALGVPPQRYTKAVLTVRKKAA